MSKARFEPNTLVKLEETHCYHINSCLNISQLRRKLNTGSAYNIIIKYAAYKAWQHILNDL